MDIEKKRIEDAKSNIANVVTTLKDSSDMFIYVMGKMHPAGAAFVGVALFIKNLAVSTAQDPNTEVLEKLQEVQHQIQKLNDSMGKHFNGMKAFIVAKDFYERYAVEASVLLKNFGNTAEKLDQKKRETAVKIFKEMYEKANPMKMAQTLRGIMDHDDTNPLKMAMTGDDFKTKKTFQKWKKMILGVFTQLYVLECFASGMFHDCDTFRQDQVDKEHKEFEELAKQYEEYYKTSEHSFWPTTIRHFVEDVQEKHSSDDSSTKAEIIRNKLDEIMTNDVYYVVVIRSSFDHSTVPREGFESQHIHSANRGDCTVIIWQSKKARANGAAVRELRKKAQKYRSVKHLKRESWKIDWGEVKGWVNGIENCGFMELVRSGEYVAIASTSAAWSQHGPGISFRGTFNQNGRFSSDYFHLICGFE